MTDALAIRVFIPGPLRSACGGASQLTLEGAVDVRAALIALEQQYPQLYRNVCDETGTPRRHLNIFVNETNTRDAEGVATALAPGDVVSILPAVSGG